MDLAKAVPSVHFAIGCQPGMFANPSNPSIRNQSREIMYARRFLGQLFKRPSDFLWHAKTYVSIYHILSKHALPFILVFTLSMTYGINHVRPYNDP